MNELFTNVSAEYVPLGGDLRGYFAHPASGGPHPGVVVFMEAFGINGYIESEVRRLAAAGYAAIAPDLFRGKTFAYGDTAFVEHMKSLSDVALMADTKATLAYLDGRSDVKHDAYGAVGFCMGGRLAYLTAAEFGAKIAAAASMYGGGIAPPEGHWRSSLLDRIPAISANLLLIYGAEDHGIEPAEHGRIAEALSRAEKRYTLDVYPGAGHGFASRDRDSYRPEQAEAAWAATLRLFSAELDHPRSA